MLRRLLFAAAALLALALASGCSKKSSSPTSPGGGGGGGGGSTDQVQVASAISASGTLVDDQFANSASPFNVSDTTGTGFVLLAWHQAVSADSSSWTYQFSDSDSTRHPVTCIATLRRHIVGMVVIQPERAPGDTTHADTTAIDRPFDKTVVRQVLLQRIPVGGQRVWKIIRISGEREDYLGATARIQSVRLLGAGIDTTITDPTQLVGLNSIVTFNPGDSVTVMVTPLNSSDAIFLRLTGLAGGRLTRHGSDQHFRFPTDVSMTGWRSLSLTDVTEKSLTDTTAATRFDANGWHILYRIRGGQPDVSYWPQ